MPEKFLEKIVRLPGGSLFQAAGELLHETVRFFLKTILLLKFLEVKMFAQEDLRGIEEVLFLQGRNNFVLDRLLKTFGGGGEIAISQNGAKQVGLANRPEGIPEEAYPDLLDVLSHHLLEEGNHLEVLPHPGEGEPGPPGHLPFQGEEFFIEELGDA